MKWCEFCRDHFDESHFDADGNHRRNLDMYVIFCLGLAPLPLAFGPFDSKEEAQNNLSAHIGDVPWDICRNGIPEDQHYIIEVKEEF